MVTAGLTHAVADVANLDMSVHAGLGDRIAMAGVKAGAGVITDTVINGDGLGEALRSGALSMATTVASQELFRSVGDIAETLDIDDGDLRKVVAHAVVGCAVGQITDNCVAGAIGAGLQELTGDTVDALAETPEGRVALSGLIAGATVLLAGGDADAVRAADGIARDARSFNRQLHIEEVRRIRELAKDFAEQQGISEPEARQLLLAQAMRTVDRTYGDTHADWDQAAEIFLRRHATDTIEIDGTDVLMFTPGGEDGAFYKAPELLAETWGLFEEEFRQAHLDTPVSLRSEKMADQQAVLDAYLTVVSMMPYGGAFIAAAVEYEQAVRDGDHERADAIKQGVLIDLATSKVAVVRGVLERSGKTVRTPGAGPKAPEPALLAREHYDSLYDLFDKNNVRNDLTINGKTIDVHKDVGWNKERSTVVLDSYNLTDMDIANYARELAGGKALGKVADGVYSTKLDDGSTVTLRSVSTSKDRTGARWTVEIRENDSLKPLKPSAGKDNKVEVKFR